MLTVAAESEDELIADILDRARCGRKVMPLAIALGIPPKAVYRTAVREDTPLKRGRPIISPLNGGSVKEYRRYLDERYWAGFARDFLRDAQTVSLEKLAGREKYREHGLKTRQRLHEIYTHLTGGQSKPDPQCRRDITRTRLEKLARSKKYKSAIAIAKRLNTTATTVFAKAANWGIKLPNTAVTQRARTKKLMSEVKALRNRGWRVPDIARKLGVHPNTIWLWNRRNKYSLWRLQSRRN